MGIKIAKEVTGEVSSKKSMKLIWPCIGAIAIVLIIILGAYYNHFFIKLGYVNSIQPGDWGAFGDYFGGILNPIVGMAALVFVAITLSLTSKALEQGEKIINQNEIALNHSRAELEENLNFKKDEKEVASIENLVNHIKRMLFCGDEQLPVNDASTWIRASRDTIQIIKHFYRIKDEECRKDTYFKLEQFSYYIYVYLTHGGRGKPLPIYFFFGAREWEKYYSEKKFRECVEYSKERRIVSDDGYMEGSDEYYANLSNEPEEISIDTKSIMVIYGFHKDISENAEQACKGVDVSIGDAKDLFPSFFEENNKIYEYGNFPSHTLGSSPIYEGAVKYCEFQEKDEC